MMGVQGQEENDRAELGSPDGGVKAGGDAEMAPLPQLGPTDGYKWVDAYALAGNGPVTQ